MNFTADRALFEGQHNCTGVVGPRLDFSANVGPGQPRPQAVNEDGVLLWVVEAPVSYTHLTLPTSDLV